MVFKSANYKRAGEALGLGIAIPPEWKTYACLTRNGCKTFLP